MEKIEQCEKEVDFLCQHESWAAAEGANERKCYQINLLRGTLPEAQKHEIDRVLAKSFLKYLSKVTEKDAAYPKISEIIKNIISKEEAA